MIVIEYTTLDPDGKNTWARVIPCHRFSVDGNGTLKIFEYADVDPSLCIAHGYWTFVRELDPTKDDRAANALRV